MIHVYGLSLEKCDDDEHPLTGYIYLHGKLQAENGFDLCHIDELPKEDGVYDCEVTLSNGTIKKARLYFWRTRYRNRGLIVDPDHVGDNLFANTKYKIRSTRL